MLPALEPWQWTLGAVCAFCVGVAKTGVPGLGMMVVPMMVLTVGDARESAAWLLPILCTADVFAVLYWRRHAAVNRLFQLAPWVLVGMGLGAWALAFPERWLRVMVGVIVLAMLGAYVRRRMRPDTMFTEQGAPYGVAAGFATTVANAAGPVMNLYLLSKRLPKEEFIATGAWFFFVINLTKVPIYVGHQLFSRQSLVFDLLMVPAVLAGALTGRWLFNHIPQLLFERLAVAMTVISTVMLFR